MIKNFICIKCPRGCMIDVTLENDQIVNIHGNTCINGENYVKEEIYHPKRIVTSTVKITNAKYDVLPVKTDKDLNKELVFKLMDLLKTIEVQAPIKVNDIIIKNVFGTDANIIATRTLEKI